MASHSIIPNGSSGGKNKKPVNLRKRLRLEGVSEKFIRLIETMNEGVWIGDNKERTLYANPKFCEWMEYDLEDMFGRESYEFWTEESANRVRGVNITDRKGGVSSGYEGELLSKNGKKIPVWLSGTPLPDGGTIGIMTDLRPIKRKEEALNISQKRYKELADTLPQVVFEMDQKGRLLFVNKNGFKVFGYSEKDFAHGLNAFEMIVEEDRERARHNITNTFHQKDVIPNEYTAIKSNGDKFPIIIHSNPIRRKGKFVGIRGIIVDITDQKKNEEYIQKLSNVVEQAGDLVYITNKDGIIEYVNKAVENTTKYTVEELIGKTPRIFKSGRYSKEFYKHLWDKILSGEPFRAQIINKKKNGDLFYEEKTITPLKDKKGDVTHFVSTGKNITENKEAEKRLEKINKCLLKYGPDPLENIRKTIATCGEVFGAHYTVYNRLKGGQLYRAANWNVPKTNNFNVVPKGHVCYEAISGKTDEIRVMNNLNQSKYSKSDPNINIHNLKTYVGHAVESHRKIVGVMCSLFKKDYHPSERDSHLFGILASAIGVEEERLQYIQEIKGSEDRYRTIFENTGSATIIIEEDTTISIINEEFEKLSGYTKKEVENNLSWKEFFTMDEITRMMKYHSTRRKNPNIVPRNYEAKFVDKKDRIKYVYLTASIIPGTKKTVASLIDISDRRKSEEALKESKLQLELALKGADLGLWDWNVITGYNSFNKRWADMLGYSISEIEHDEETWEKMVHPDDLSRVLKIRERHMRGEIDLYETEYRMKHKHGEWVWIMNRGKVVEWDKRGNPIRLTGTHLDITARKNAEEELRVSEEKYRSMIDQSIVGFCMFEGTKIVFANQKVANIFGYKSPEELMGKEIKKFLLQDSYRHAKKKTIARQKGESIPSLGEYIGIKKSGKHINLQTFSKLIEIKGDVFSQVFVIDVTEQKMMEIKLKERVKEFNVLYRVHAHTMMSSRISKVFTDITGDVTHAFEFTDIVAAQIIFDGKVYKSSNKELHFVHKIERPINIRGHKRGKIQVGYTKKLTEHRVRPFWSEERKLVESVAHIIEKHISSREMVERFQKVVKKAVTGIFIAQNGKLKYVNPRFYTMFKSRPKDVIENCASKFLPDKYCQERFVKISGRPFDTYGVRKDGKKIDLEVVVQKIDYHGKPALIGRLHDVSKIKEADRKLRNFNRELKSQVEKKTVDLQRANKRLQSLNELKDEFIAVTSHELRSPLTSVRGYLSLVNDPDVLSEIPEEIRRYIQKAYSNSESLNYLVNNILDVSRLDMGRFELQTATVDMVKFIQGLIENLSFQAGEKKLKLIFNNKTNQKTLNMKVDMIRLSQVLRNLLDNAIKFTKQGKNIYVTLEKNHKCVTIKVVDQGIGIAKVQLDQIFEKFMQVRNSDTRYKGGAGLGLFIAKRIVELHKGKLEAESQKGKGTTFTITLPIS